MAKVIRWACPDCDQETHFKGLCRDCTEYDDEGSPVKPVHRVRLNHNPTPPKQNRKTKEAFVNSRRRNPTKKQLEAMKDALNEHSAPVSLQHEHDENCDPNCGHADFVEVGESIGGEEE